MQNPKLLNIKDNIFTDYSLKTDLRRKHKKLEFFFVTEIKPSFQDNKGNESHLRMRDLDIALLA